MKITVRERGHVISADPKGKVVHIEGNMFTGIKDINDNDIYSGDEITLQFKGLTNFKGKVEFVDGEFGVWWKVKDEDGEGDATWVSLRAISNLRIERVK